MRALIVACLMVSVVMANEFQPRVKFFEGPAFNSQTREAALTVCLNMNMHIAHESQLVLDIEDGFEGHAKCGWSWTRGRRVHVHCDEKEADGKKCKKGKSRVMACSDTKDHLPPPSGVYCRVFTDTESRTPFKLPPGELNEIYRAHGPDGPNTIMNVEEAKAVCQSHGAILAYWTHLAAYVERYGIRICQYSWLREANAVFNANCENDDTIKWQIRDRNRGYDAICLGHVPHKYRDPCTSKLFQFRTLEGMPIECSDDDYIIIQDRPPCSQEENSFKKDWGPYTKGFGEVGKGYWMGLEPLAKLTKAYKFELVIEVENQNGAKYYAKYKKFSVSGLEDQFRLTATEYSGNAGDMFNEIQSNSLTSNGAQFSTFKHDNDGSDLYNCAKEYGSGWWFQSCHLDNLNGPCPKEEAYSEAVAATRTWRHVSVNTTGLRSTRMKIKYIGDYDRDYF